MNFSRTLKLSLITTLLSLATSDVFSYRFTVTNMTDKPIKFIPSAWLAGTMLHGHEGTNCKVLGTIGKDLEIREVDNNVYIQNACALKAPYLVKPTQTVEYEFSNGDVGFCFDLGAIKVGMKKHNYSMMPVEVKSLPNEAYDKFFKSLSLSGGSVKKLGEAIGENFGDAIDEASNADPDPESKAAIKAAANAVKGIGKLGEVAGELIDEIGQLIQSSSCKDMSFVAVPTKDGESVILLTRQLGSSSKQHYVYKKSKKAKDLQKEKYQDEENRVNGPDAEDSDVQDENNDLNDND